MPVAASPGIFNDCTFGFADPNALWNVCSALFESGMDLPTASAFAWAFDESAGGCAEVMSWSNGAPLFDAAFSDSIAEEPSPLAPLLAGWPVCWTAA